MFFNTLHWHCVIWQCYVNWSLRKSYLVILPAPVSFTAEHSHFHKKDRGFSYCRIIISILVNFFAKLEVASLKFKQPPPPHRSLSDRGLKHSRNCWDSNDQSLSCFAKLVWKISVGGMTPFRKIAPKRLSRVAQQTKNTSNNALPTNRQPSTALGLWITCFTEQGTRERRQRGSKWRTHAKTYTPTLAHQYLYSNK